MTKLRPLPLFLLVLLLSGCVPASTPPSPAPSALQASPPAPLLRQTANVSREPTTYRFTIAKGIEGRTLALLVQTEATAPQMGMHAIVEQGGAQVTALEFETNPFLKTVRFPAAPGEYAVTLSLPRSSRSMAVQLHAWLEPGGPLTPEQRVEIWDGSIRLPAAWQGLVTPDGWVTFAGGDDLTLTIGPPGGAEGRPANIGAAVQAALAHITGSPDPSPILEPTDTGVQAPALKTRVGAQEYWIYAVPAGDRFLVLILASGAPEARREALLQAGAAIVQTFETRP
ncbi:MAG: hypothetical protein ACOY94_15060 [Bacillota bacterium]